MNTLVSDEPDAIFRQQCLRRDCPTSFPGSDGISVSCRMGVPSPAHPNESAVPNRALQECVCERYF